MEFIELDVSSKMKLVMGSVSDLICHKEASRDVDKVW